MSKAPSKSAGRSFRSHAAWCMGHEMCATGGNENDSKQCCSRGLTLRYALSDEHKSLDGCTPVPVQLMRHRFHALVNHPVAILSAARCWRRCCAEALQAESLLPLSLLLLLSLPLQPNHVLA